MQTFVLAPGEVSTMAAISVWLKYWSIYPLNRISKRGVVFNMLQKWQKQLALRFLFHSSEILTDQAALSIIIFSLLINEILFVKDLVISQLMYKAPRVF